MDVDKLQVGDLVACEMTAGFKNVIHRGVYVGETDGIGEHTIIHNFCAYCTRNSNGEIEGSEQNWITDAKMPFNIKTGGGIVIWTVEDFRNSANNYKWWIDNMEETLGKAKFSGNEVVERARKEEKENIAFGHGIVNILQLGVNLEKQKSPQIKSLCNII
uniref:LRAT domain-containing protein n=1 Tax=Meloidogyne incognita TaxID=6306 RepID=A0A914KSI3_MELIC